MRFEVLILSFKFFKDLRLHLGIAFNFSLDHLAFCYNLQGITFRGGQKVVCILGLCVVQRLKNFVYVSQDFCNVPKFLFLFHLFSEIWFDKITKFYQTTKFDSLQLPKLIINQFISKRFISSSLPKFPQS